MKSKAAEKTFLWPVSQTACSTLDNGAMQVQIYVFPIIPTKFKQISRTGLMHFDTIPSLIDKLSYLSTPILIFPSV